MNYTNADYKHDAKTILIDLLTNPEELKEVFNLNSEIGTWALVIKDDLVPWLRAEAEKDRPAGCEAAVKGGHR